MSAPVSAGDPVYIVTTPQTFAGLREVVTDVSPLYSSSRQARVLVRTDEAGVERLARYVHQQEGRCGGFFAFSSRVEAEAFVLDDRSAQALTRPMAVSYSIDNASTVEAWLPQVDEFNIHATIATLSGETPPYFQNRYYASPHGEAAALWIHDTWLALAVGHPGASVALHADCSNCGGQPSVILRLDGTDLADEVVVVGAHLDSINAYAGGNPNQIAPGADDDASGVATVTEIIRIALGSGWQPRRSVEFHAYAAEELGLRGSNAIATDYFHAGIDVVGMLQLDMTNYRTTAPYDLRFITDNTNADLQAFFVQLFDAYLAPLGLTYGSQACGYGCSDHASWTGQGYPAGMLFEAGARPAYPGDWGDFPWIHSANDTLANLGDTAAPSAPFAQFGLAFIGELGKTDPLSGKHLFSDGFEP